MVRTFTYLFIFTIIPLLLPAKGLPAQEQPGIEQPVPTPRAFSKNPVFIENKGQVIDTDGNARPDILFVADLPGKKVYFRQTGISYVLVKHEETNQSIHEFEALVDLNTSGTRHPAPSTQLHRLDVNFLNSHPSTKVLGNQKATPYFNYYFPHCPDGITHVASYNKITYKDIYPDIDLVFYITNDPEHGSGLKYDFVVRPGGNPAMIKIQYNGAEKIFIDATGNLVIETPLGNLIENTPISFQDGKKIKTSFILEKIASLISSKPSLITYNSSPITHNHPLPLTHHSSLIIHNSQLITLPTVSFQLASYNPSLPLTIDPFVRAWATFLGGNNSDWGADIVSDSLDNAYVVGSTQSTNFPVSTGAFQTTLSSSHNGYITKFDSSGSLVWSTYYGGSTSTTGFSNIAIYNSTYIYIGGGGWRK